MLKRPVAFGFIVIMVMLPLASAVQLPAAISNMGFTVTLLSYDLSTDGRQVVLHGLIRFERPVPVRILSASGMVSSDRGFLGEGTMTGGIVELQPYSDTAVNVQVVSQYSYVELVALNVGTIQVHAEAQYCIPFAFWCIGVWIPLPEPNTVITCSLNKCTLTYERTLTRAELIAIMQQTGLV